jgi:hypothetical protein
MEIDAEFDFNFNGDGYPGSQYCLGDGNTFQCKGDVGAGSNVTKVRFASQSNGNSVHTSSSSDTTTSGSWTKTHTCRSSGLSGDGSFTAPESYAYLEVYVAG